MKIPLKKKEKIENWKSNKILHFLHHLSAILLMIISFALYESTVDDCLIRFVRTFRNKIKRNIYKYPIQIKFTPHIYYCHGIYNNHPVIPVPTVSILNVSLKYRVNQTRLHCTILNKSNSGEYIKCMYNKYVAYFKLKKIKV